jgi:N-acetylmuramoyl-L-alanine amidase
VAVHSGAPNDRTLPLAEGDCGEAVSDLQARLSELDLVSSDPLGVYGRSTVDAVTRFQEERDLPTDGVCNSKTWLALVGAGYRLGDRLLYLRRPMLRGDDVADLQHRLSALGFDPGGVDAIFGDRTEVALRDFQHNAGLPADGRCGQETLADLLRFSPREGGKDLVSPLRERLQLARNSSRTLEGRRFAIGESGGFSSGVASLSRGLYAVGAFALALHDPDLSRQAREANAAGVDCYIGLRIVAERSSCATAFYKGFRYESVTSRRLAELVQQRLPLELGLEDDGICGLALPILRETQMPAIEVQLGEPSRVTQRTTQLAASITAALESWVTESFE